jgi:hypothetical protein
VSRLRLPPSGWEIETGIKEVEVEVLMVQQAKSAVCMGFCATESPVRTINLTHIHTQRIRRSARRIEHTDPSKHHPLQTNKKLRICESVSETSGTSSVHDHDVAAVMKTVFRKFAITSNIPPRPSVPAFAAGFSGRTWKWDDTLSHQSVVVLKSCECGFQPVPGYIRKQARSANLRKSPSVISRAMRICMPDS